MVPAASTSSARPKSTTALEFLAFVVAGGVLSVLKREDVNFDLRNYHYYNPWAWLNDRIGWDLAPAQLQSYINPLLDLPFFLLVQADVSPRLVGFVMGLPCGAALAFFFWTVRYVCRNLEKRDRRLILTLSLLVGMTGAAGVALIGSTMNEWHVAALVLASVYLVVSSRGEAARHALAGFLAGAVFGLKFTAGPYGIALGVMAAMRHDVDIGRRLRAVTAMAAGGAAGFAAAYGYWGYVLWREFANPFYPFFNGIFRSPDWFPESFRDDRYGAGSFSDWLLLPFRLAVHGTVASDAPQRDPRLAILVVVVLALAATSTRLHGLLRLPARAPAPTTEALRDLGIFWVCAFVLWYAVFGVYRYFIPLELLGSFLIVYGLWRLFPPVKWRSVVLACVCLGIAGYTDRPKWGRKRFGDSYFDVRAPALPKGSLVLMYGDKGLSYLLPFLGTEHRYVRLTSNLTGPSQKHGMARRIEKAIREHDGPIFVIRQTVEDGTLRGLLLFYGLAEAEPPRCLQLRSVVDNDIQLCAVKDL